MLAASLPLLWLFWRHEQRIEAAGRDPILAPSLLRIPGLKSGLLVCLCGLPAHILGLSTGWPWSAAFRGWRCNPPCCGWLRFGAIRKWNGPPLLRTVFRRCRHDLGGGRIVRTAALISFGAPEFLFVALFVVGAGQGIALPNLVKTVVQRADRTLQIGGALATVLIGGLFFSILGSSIDVVSIGRAYSASAVAIAFSLLVAGWLSVGPTSTREIHRKA